MQRIAVGTRYQGIVESGGGWWGIVRFNFRHEFFKRRNEGRVIVESPLFSLSEKFSLSTEINPLLWWDMINNMDIWKKKGKYKICLIHTVW